MFVSSIKASIVYFVNTTKQLYIRGQTAPDNLDRELTCGITSIYVSQLGLYGCSTCLSMISWHAWGHNHSRFLYLSRSILFLNNYTATSYKH